MRVWIDVSDSAGNRLGAGPIVNVIDAQITRALDGAGSFSARIGVDGRAIELLVNERRVAIWGEDTGGVRLLGEGIIRKRKLGDAPGGLTLSIDGPDILDELKRRSALLARIYNQQTVQTVIDDLIALVPGWSVNVAAGIASDVIDARFDGVNVLKALQEIVKRYGYHLRASTTASKTVEIGTFGTANGLRVMGVQVVTQETIANPSLLMVQQISLEEDSESVYNWLLPMGAGEGVAALTLEKSTRTTPYTIQTMTGPDGTTLYYVKDSASITAIGEIRKVGQFKTLAPLTNSATDIENAANALYDAAVEALTRHKDAQMAYRVNVKNVQETILPGDKVTIHYKAQIDTDSGIVDYLNIRDDFWVIAVTEQVNEGGTGVNMEVSNVDRARETVAQKIVGELDAMEVRGLKPPISSSPRSYVYPREIASEYPAVVPIEFTDATLYLQRVRVRVKTSSFRATASAAAAGGGVTSNGGGNHRHLMFKSTGVTGSATFNYRYYTVARSSGDQDLSAYLFQSPDSSDMYTYDSSGEHTHTLPTHTHTLSYGIADDSATPIDVTVWVNGTNRTSLLTGSATLAPSGGNLNVVLDAGELTTLLEDDTGGLRQVHSLEIRCASGQGRVEVTVEIFEVTQAIKI